MLGTGKALKVSIYLSEGSTHHHVPAASSILDFLYFRGVSGATVIKGVAGFGADHHLHTASVIVLSDHLPIKVEFIETPEKVNELLDKLEEMAGSGMIEVQETNVVKAATSSKAKQKPPPPHFRKDSTAQMMRIYICESDRWRERPLHDALVDALRANDIAGVTGYKGILGYGANRALHKSNPLHLAHDCSMMLSVIDTDEKIRSVLPILETMIGDGLIVISDVEVIKYSHGANAAGGISSEDSSELRS